ETAINRVLDCPSCQRRFVAKRSASPPPPKRSLGCLLLPLLVLLVAGGALGYVCWRQQASPLALARQFLQNDSPSPAPAASPPTESVLKEIHPLPEDPEPPAPESQSTLLPESTPTAPEPPPSPSTPPPAIDPRVWLLTDKTRWP